ncbi:Hypothetical protein CAP_8679 [Chondromyces apiculatus DSM 436]|uniref:Uncharacterized protein n=1 Tax=Chondromyces apiculatus DSM 436 TaxID=1192034 RepID=A0A017TG67_9BACT|nr:Hypothetical protein CAP_8679 [Chondromyces apiculatus DSM 436]
MKSARPTLAGACLALRVLARTGVCRGARDAVLPSLSPLTSGARRHASLTARAPIAWRERARGGLRRAAGPAAECRGEQEPRRNPPWERRRLRSRGARHCLRVADPHGPPACLRPPEHGEASRSRSRDVVPPP